MPASPITLPVLPLDSDDESLCFDSCDSYESEVDTDTAYTEESDYDVEYSEADSIHVEAAEMIMDAEDDGLKLAVVPVYDHIMEPDQATLTTANDVDGSTMTGTCNNQEANDWNGFKIVGDNLDKLVKTRYMRLNKQNRSINYFNSFAVKDRIDLSSLSGYKPCIVPDVDMHEILPSDNTHVKLLNNMAMIVSRILVEHIPAFKLYFEDVVVYHLEHPYSQEMSKKSETVQYNA